MLDIDPVCDKEAVCIEDGKDCWGQIKTNQWTGLSTKDLVLKHHPCLPNSGFGFVAPPLSPFPTELNQQSPMLIKQSNSDCPTTRSFCVSNGDSYWDSVVESLEVVRRQVCLP